MPVYEYLCTDHGVFEALRPMSQYDQPCPCPDCGAGAARVMLSVPNVSGLDRSVRRAHETNERASHAPKSLRSHGPGCGCCAGGASSVKGRGRGGTLHRPDGSKSFPGKRPWMISH